MPYVLLFVLVLFINLDAYVLKRRDRNSFNRMFYVSLSKTVLIGLFLGGFSFFFKVEAEKLLLLIVGVGLTYYLLRRIQFAGYLEQGLEKNSVSNLTLISDALGVVLIWVFCMVGFSSFLKLISLLFPSFQSELGELLISAVISSGILILLIFKVSQKFSDQGFLANISLRKQNRSVLKVIVAPIIIGIFFAFCSAMIITTRDVQPQTPLNDVIGETQSVNILLAFLFVGICVAPLAEEIIFRGYFFYVIRRVWGMKWAIVSISLVFAFLHVGQYWGDWLAILMVTILGFVLTGLRASTGTTLSSVMTHYAYNAGVTVIPIIMLVASNPAYFKYQAYYDLHDAVTKESLLKESLKRDPDLADAYHELAWLYYEEEKNLEEALELIQKALVVGPEKFTYLDTKVAILSELDRLKEAQEVRDYVLEKYPDQQIGRIRRGKSSP